jgi:hypothetical protein
VLQTLYAQRLPPKQMRHHFCAGRPSISIAHAAISGRGTSTHAALCDTVFACIQAWRRNVKLLLGVPGAPCSTSAPEADAPPFLGTTCVDAASPSGNSAAAAPAPTQLSATQHLPAPGHDDTPPSSSLVCRTLQAPQLPPKQERWIFCAACASRSIAQPAS